MSSNMATLSCTSEDQFVESHKTSKTLCCHVVFVSAITFSRHWLNIDSLTHVLTKMIVETVDISVRLAKFLEGMITSYRSSLQCFTVFTRNCPKSLDIVVTTDIIFTCSGGDDTSQRRGYPPHPPASRALIDRLQTKELCHRTGIVKDILYHSALRS